MGSYRLIFKYFIEEILFELIFSKFSRIFSLTLIFFTLQKFKNKEKPNIGMREELKENKKLRKKLKMIFVIKFYKDIKSRLFWPVIKFEFEVFVVDFYNTLFLGLMKSPTFRLLKGSSSGANLLLHKPSIVFISPVL